MPPIRLLIDYFVYPVELMCCMGDNRAPDEGSNGPGPVTSGEPDGENS